MKIFISGPMTGIENYNFPKFNEVEKFLVSEGHEVVNPVKICKKYKKEVVLSDRSVFDKMVNEELETLKTCDMICFLPGWDKSKGALKEFDVAVENKLGMITIDAMMKMKELDKISI